MIPAGTMMRLCGCLAALLLTDSTSGQPLRVTQQPTGFRAETATLALECRRDLQFRVFLKKAGGWTTLSPASGLPPVFSASGLGAFAISGVPAVQHRADSRFGLTDRLVLDASFDRVVLTLAVDFPRRFPDVIVLESRLHNTGSSSVRIGEISQAALRLSAGDAAQDGTFFWSLNGGGYRGNSDYILPVRAGFARDNYVGPKGGDSGGGTPFVDLWRPEMGMAVAVLDAKPVLASLPVSANGDGLADIRAISRLSAVLRPGDNYTAPLVMIAAHEGDFYTPLVRYRELMGDLGVRPGTDYTPDDYAPMWGTWGYQKLFTIDTMLSRVRMMRRLSMRDLTMDDGWYDRFGDWQPVRSKFPRGDEDLKALIRKLHEAGLTFRLWWTPGVADPDSEIARLHPDWFVLDRNGARAKASWTSYYLCPAYAPVRSQMRTLVRRFVADWDVDSFKLDGTCLNHAPLCYNRSHRHARPEESFEQWPGIFVLLRAESRRLKPGFRTQLCPCGIAPTFHLMAGMEQSTTADPWDNQVTSRAKILKAMTGAHAPLIEEYAGLSPSTLNTLELAPRAIGAGQVYATFHPAMGVAHVRWASIYNKHRPAQGEYLNLYDIRWEKTEGHAIRKGTAMYYGFFTKKPGDDYSGTIQLRGLERQKYQVTDYANDRVMGMFEGPSAELPVFFHDALLLVAEPLGR